MSRRFDRWSNEGAPSGEEAARLQRGIDQTMGDVIRKDARANPIWQMPLASKVGVVGAVPAAGRGTGWRNATPLAPPLHGTYAEKVMGEPRLGDWGLIRQHIEEVVAGGNEEFADYVIRWFA